MELKNRIAVVIKVNNQTPASFAEALGVQRSSISHILNGRNKPSIDFIEKLLIAFPRVDAGWLITGKEPASQHSHPKELTASVDREIESPVQSAPSNSAVGKSIDMIVIFYTDGTFGNYKR